jgi:hypothetical protein
VTLAKPSRTQQQAMIGALLTLEVMSGHGREMGFAIMEALTQEQSVWVSMR